MKSITFNGNIIIESNANRINEGKIWNSKKSILGNLLSFIPGFGEKMSGKEDTDKYAESQKKWFNAWQDRRKRELEADANHMVEMKVHNYEILQQQKLNKHDAERKVKEFKQKQELDARKAVLKRLEQENKKITTWTLGPSTPEYMAHIINATNKIYEDATPAEQKAKDNILGILTEINYKDGKFLGSQDAVEARLDELYGDGTKGSGLKNPVFDTPEWRDAWSDYTKNRPKTEEEFTKSVAKRIIGDKFFKTDDELNEYRDKLEARLKEIENDDRTIKDLEDQKKQLEDNIKKLDELEQKAEDAKKMKKDWESTNPSEIRSATKGMIKDLVSNPKKDKDGNEIPLTINDETEGVPAGTQKINPKHPAFKQLKALGLGDTDLNAVINNGEINEKTLDGKLKDIDDKKFTEFRDNVVAQADATINEYENAKTSHNDNKTQLEQVKKKLSTAESDKTTHDKNAAEVNKIARQYTGKANDGTPITIKDLRQASTAVENQKEENQKALKEVENMRQRAEKIRGELGNDKRFKAAYDKLSDEDRHKIDTVTAKPVNVIHQDGDRSYMEVDGEEDDPNNPGKKRKKRLYKPKEDDPDYETKLKMWDTAVSAKYATMKIGTKPELPENPTPEDLIEIKQWEANKKAKEAAVQSFLDDKSEIKDKLNVKSPEDALDYLADKEWLDDPENADKTEFDDDEDANETDVEDKQETKDKKEKEDRIKELQAKIDSGELSDEDKKNTQDEINNLKKQIEDADNAKDDSAKRNPSRIWKKKKNKTTGKSTKRYYYCGKNTKRREAGESISQKEYQEKMKKYKEAKTNTNESLNNQQQPIQFKKSPWTTTRLSETKK